VWFNVDVNRGATVEFYAEVDPDNLSAETDKTNNRFPATGTIALEFEKRDEFTVLGWRMRYHPPVSRATSGPAAGRFTRAGISG
jgi:hypothetical protein